MSDGTTLRQSWYNALNDAQSSFRHLLTSASSQDWKRVPVASDSASTLSKGNARSSVPDVSDVVIHRKTRKSGDTVYRVILDVPTGDEPISLDAWKSVLTTPELRKEWDPAVESAALVEMFDPTTRVSKTKFTLGWPANPRDAVTISRTFNDATTVIDISTSLPRSPDEPAYLRPSPPYVRSNVKLFSWCIQHIPSLPSANPPSAQEDDQPSRKLNPGRLRITCFWQHDLRAIWNFGSTSGFSQQLASMVLGLFKTVVKRGSRVPVLTGYGNGVSIERLRFDINREALTLDYAIIPEDDDHESRVAENPSLDELHAIREHRRLTRTVEFSIPAAQGWDIQVSTKASSEEVAKLPWSARAIRTSPESSSDTADDRDDVLLRVNHSPLIDDHSILKVCVVIERSGPSSGLRLNGIPQAIEAIEERSPSSYFMSQQMQQDATSTADTSFRTASSAATAVSTLSSGSKTPLRPELFRTQTERSAAAEKNILSRVRRNYIYFSSLLQEPEAKWKRTTEARGVSITQLDSIDPTLVVYRAEATFVGVGLWDLYAAITSPGTRQYWDKQHEDAVLLEDVNELTELWHIKSKPTWPANARDSVLLKTVYKSPSTIHVFSFSADDPNLFPNIPPVDASTIRTQVDLQGFSIEALSPTTTLLTLLEQSDPKGWATKSSIIPQQMIVALAGIGEFAIKYGGPPTATRLAGARARTMNYDHERGVFRMEYEVSASRRSGNGDQTTSASQEGDAESASNPVVECELRCDIDTWATSLDIVVDPPPQSITCLRRHRLSSGGGGLWLTLTHDAVLAGDERLQVIVRKGPGRERGIVMVNGSKVAVDVEDLPEHELKSLSKQKRVKPARIPLDQPPVVGVIRRRKAEWNGEGENGSSSDSSEKPPSPTVSEGRVSPIKTSSIWGAFTPKFSSPLSRYFTFAVEQATSTTEQAVAALTPTSGDGAAPSASKPPMQHALEALSYVQSLYAIPISDAWALVSTKGFPIYRKLEPRISSSIPVHRAEKVIEGISAEEIAAVISSYDCRKRWDDCFDSAHVLEAFGGENRTAFVVNKGGFPFRDRGFYLASVQARGQRARNDADSPTSGEGHSPIFIVSASFNPASISQFATEKYNSYGLPIGRMFVDAWVLETLDPYTPENYAIPSTRCTRVVAADYAGSVPVAVNSLNNTALAKTILAVETYVKGISPLPLTRLPTCGLLLVDKRSDDRQESSAWALKKKDANRTLVQTQYFPDEQVYRSTMLLSFPPPVSPAASPVAEQTTPKAGVPESVSTDSVSSEPRQSRGHSLSVSSVSSPRHRRVSSSTVRARSPSSETALRVSSSAFTLKGEVRQHTDLLAAEIIVDSKLYPDGYEVQLRSRIQSGSTAIPLLAPGGKLPDESVLPLTYTVHTLPSSPLHSSSLTSDSPSRHLLRFMLPTAQQQISTLQDPLTGETRGPRPKPQWLVDLQEKGAVLDVEVRPAGKILATRKSKSAVTIDGNAVKVESEKESLTSLGRDELQEDRVAWMTTLTRLSSDNEDLPKELEVPIAVAEHLLDPSVTSEESAASQESKEAEDGSVSSGSSQAPSVSHPPESSTLADVVPPTPATGGFLGFLNAYPIASPLLRFTSASGATSPASSTAQSPAATSEAASALTRASGNRSRREARLGRGASVLTLGKPHASYPLSTVIVVALIAFLIGSLLRSLISPADFIYVVTDLKEAEEVVAGWREIKRLLEVKYIVGGWDFQIAVVRRH
ncbi:hypothetical protein DENSPDRAFT_797515 [Dentipellis sp. KUC8613]|nr:hypothetical protein DENSPDRAFT_797515 [Dentipellis sp. KUC8613]